MESYTEEMRLKDEYPTIGQKVILNILEGAVQCEKERQYNGSELIVVKNRSEQTHGLPIFYCVEHGFEISINNAHFKALDSAVYTTTLNSSGEAELKSRAMVSELNSETNYIGPKTEYTLGQEVILLGNNQETKGKVVSLPDKVGKYLVKTDTGFHMLVDSSEIKEYISEQDNLVAKLNNLLNSNNAPDNYILAMDIINGGIKGLTFDGDV